MENRKIIIASLKIQHNTEEGKKEFQILSQFLRKYLRENHYMFILSNASAPSSVERMAQLYENLCTCLEASQNSFFYFYAIGNTLSYINNAFSQFCVAPFQKKENVLDTIISDFSITRKDNLLGAGNDANDIVMLLKISDLNGTCFYVNRYFDEEMNEENLIRTIAFKRAKTLVKQKHIDALTYDEEEFVAFSNAYHSLKEDFLAQKINRTMLQKMYSYLSIINEYNLLAKNMKPLDSSLLEKKLILVKNQQELYTKMSSF